jgi:hypothetical protein
MRCINAVLKDNKFDEVMINGDVCDFPYISRHPKKLYPEGILKDYTEIGEIEYTKEQILQPLRLSTNAKIRVRLGNHDERITKPQLLSEKQLAKLAVMYKNYNTTDYDKMLGLNTDDFIYDDSTVYTYFDMFDVTHGLSLAKNAPEMNIREYMSSGASGHTHRLHAYYKTNRKKPYVWVELGHTRIQEEVEYFPTGKIPDWQQGFAVVNFTDFKNPRFYLETVSIIESRCYYNGVVYDGNK